MYRFEVNQTEDGVWAIIDTRRWAPLHKRYFSDEASAKNWLDGYRQGLQDARDAMPDPWETSMVIERDEE